LGCPVDGLSLALRPDALFIGGAGTLPEAFGVHLEEWRVMTSRSISRDGMALSGKI